MRETVLLVWDGLCYCGCVWALSALIDLTAATLRKSRSVTRSQMQHLFDQVAPRAHSMRMRTHTVHSTRWHAHTHTSHTQRTQRTTHIVRTHDAHTHAQDAHIVPPSLARLPHAQGGTPPCAPPPPPTACGASLAREGRRSRWRALRRRSRERRRGWALACAVGRGGTSPCCARRVH